MPIYEYECEKCGHHFELFQKLNDPAAKECPSCGGHVRKIISSPGIMFKGSGWYVTDYSNKLKAPSEDGKKKEGSPEKSPAEKSPKETGTSPPSTPAKKPDPS